jgi:hypoxanthine-guanine phosphoribosyltransferase
MKLLLTGRDIQQHVKNLVREVSVWAEKPLHVYVIMNGAFMFAADFLRQYPGKVANVTFHRVDRGFSYFNPTEPEVQHTCFEDHVKARHFHLVLDVICEEGRTLEAFKKKQFVHRRNLHIKTCTLICRPQYSPDFYGETIPKQYFLTGYGMGPYRDLQEVYGVTQEETESLAKQFEGE